MSCTATKSPARNPALRRALGFLSSRKPTNFECRFRRVTGLAIEDPKARNVGGPQNRPARGGRGAERDLRNGLSWIFVRVPTGPQPASSAGRTVHGTADEESELGARSGHQGLFRWAFPRMAGEVRRAPDCRSARRAADPEVAERRRAGGWETNTGGGRNASGRKCFAAFGERLSSLRVRPVDPSVASKASAR